jgi:glutathione S-transferase
MTARYELIGSTLSPFVRKVRAVMALKEVAYDLTEISVFDPPEWFAGISPLKRIPVLRDRERGGAVLNDSSVIVAYLEGAYSDYLVYPADPWDRARALWIEEYMDTEFAFRMGMGLFRTRYVYPRMGKAVDEALVRKTLSDYAPNFYRYLDSALAGREWFVGGALTIADVAVVTQFMNMRLVDEIPRVEEYPHLRSYLERMFATPVFQSVG